MFTAASEPEMLQIAGALPLNPLLLAARQVVGWEQAPSVVGTGCRPLTGWGWGVALQLQQRRSLAAGSQVGERSCRGDEGGGIGPSPGTLNLQGPGSRQLPVSGMCFPRMGREQALSLSTIQGKRAVKRSGVCLNGPANNRERDLRYVNVRGCADPGSTGDNDGTSPPA